MRYGDAQWWGGVGWNGGRAITNDDLEIRKIIDFQSS